MLLSNMSQLHMLADAAKDACQSMRKINPNVRDREALIASIAGMEAVAAVAAGTVCACVLAFTFQVRCDFAEKRRGRIVRFIPRSPPKPRSRS